MLLDLSLNPLFIVQLLMQIIHFLPGSSGFIHSQLAVFANRLLWTNLTISRNINNVGLSHCGWVFIVQRTYVVWGGRCIVAFYIITVTFVVGNQEIRSEPRERKILHIMGSDGSTGAPDAGLWWFQPLFRSMPSPPPSPWLLCSKWALVWKC